MQVRSTIRGNGRTASDDVERLRPQDPAGFSRDLAEPGSRPGSGRSIPPIVVRYDKNDSMIRWHRVRRSNARGGASLLPTAQRSPCEATYSTPKPCERTPPTTPKAWSRDSSPVRTESSETQHDSWRPVMTNPPIALQANLDNEDDEGFDWSLVRKAVDPAAIVEGAVVVAGTERFWSWVLIRQIDDDGQVHFERLTPEEAATSIPRAS